METFFIKLILPGAPASGKAQALGFLWSNGLPKHTEGLSAPKALPAQGPSLPSLFLKTSESPLHHFLPEV